MPSSDPEKLREQNRRKYLRRRADPAKVAHDDERNAAWRAANRERIRPGVNARQRRYRAANYDTVRAIEVASKETHRTATLARRRARDLQRAVYLEAHRNGVSRQREEVS